MIPRRTIAAAAALALMNSGFACAQNTNGASPISHNGTTRIAVAGTGVDLLTTALIHSKDNTPTGMIQKSTEIVELKGDLNGRVLYHVTSVFDFAHGTLVNTGDQVYSGT